MIPKPTYFFNSCDMFLGSRIMLRGHSCIISFVWETGGRQNSVFLSLAPPTPKVTSFIFSRMPSPRACQVLSLAVNNHSDPSRTEGLHGISQPISSSISQSQIPGQPVQPCAQQSVQLCACFLKKGLCQLLCIPCLGAGLGRDGERPTPQALTSATTPGAAALPVLPGGCQLLPPQKYTIYIHSSESFTGNPSMLLLLSSALVLPAV